MSGREASSTAAARSLARGAAGMPLDLPAFHRFLQHITVPTRDYGLISPWPLFGTQSWMEREVLRGLEDDIHEFVILKGGRQIGGSTDWDALTLFYLQSHAGLVGSMVSDDDSNRDYRRLLMLDMLASLPVEYRWRVDVNNQGHLKWSKPNTSRLIFAAAGKRKDSNLVRSKGINFAYNDELGSWFDDRAYFSLHASYSQKHPQRLYGCISTARGIGTVFHDVWKAAKTARTQRAIFIAWWMHRDNRIERTQRALWAAYGEADRTAEERLWIEIVRRRYGIAIEQEQVAWYRWKLAEECLGDEAFMAQEYSCLPEESFQAFGDKFISAKTVRVLRLGLTTVPLPDGYDYLWAASLDETPCVAVPNSESAMVVPEESSGQLDALQRQDETAHSESLISTSGMVPDERSGRVALAPSETPPVEFPDDERVDPEAPLLVWQEPEKDGVYIVAAHPWGSSDPDATMFVCQVWRAPRDQLVQCAEYATEAGLMYQFAWVCLHLAGAYRGIAGGAYFILEQAATGLQIQREIEYVQERRYGLSPAAQTDLRDVLGSVQHYLFTRPGSFRPNPLMQWQTTPTYRPMLIYAMQDEVERGHVDVRSRALIDELAMLRRGERGNNDDVAGGGNRSAARAMTLAMAVEYWRKSVAADLPYLIGERVEVKDEPRDVGQQLVAA